MGYNSFTISVAIRWTGDEEKFIRQFLQSSVKLQPGEIILGVDAPMSDEFQELIKNIFLELNFSAYKILPVPKDDNWGFHLAHVVWTCIQTAKFDRVLISDIDTEFLNSVMWGYEKIGQNNLAMICYPWRSPLFPLTNFYRNLIHRLIFSLHDGPIQTGLFWIWRPFLNDSMKESDYMKINNGSDLYIWNKINNQKKYHVLGKVEPGCISYNVKGNPDLSWRQFQVGIWFYAHKSSYQITYAPFTIPSETNSFSILSILKRITKLSLTQVTKHMKFYIFLRSLVFAHPFLFKGYVWAEKNKTHEAVLHAEKMDFEEWTLTGSKYVEHLQNWEQKGTGFNSTK